ncbi:MAG TPA: hypothetical protein DEH22_18260, partial [Chloroflexi bacterium]|nr:hypothetical protein [Chloroflexota bacterium]
GGPIYLLKIGPPLTYQSVIVHATNAVAQSFNREGYTIRTSSSRLFFDPQTQAWIDQTPILKVVNFGPTQGNSYFSTCMNNCTQEMLKSKIFGKLVPVADVAQDVSACVEAANDSGNTSAVVGCGKAIGSKIPVIGDAIDYGTELGVCNADCQGDPNSHYCTEDKSECNSGLSAMINPATVTRRCDTDSGQYMAPEETSCGAPLVSKCIVGADGSPKCQNCFADSPRFNPSPDFSELELQQASTAPQMINASGSDDASCPFCAPAQDPNAKLGVEGLVAPGQTLAYTVQYENVGPGEAFGVFVMDQLSTVFDENTLTLGPGGKYLPASRSVLWDVGELAAKGQPGSKGEFTFMVKLRTDLPAGAVVTNRATVYFPSVPEITPTNAVVNIVQPLVGSDQRVTTKLGHPVSFTLSGFSATGGTLTYHITQQPSFGTISGTPPNLTYTPMAGYSGQDHLYFTVSNGLETSLPAQVIFQVDAEKVFLPLIIR